MFSTKPKDGPEITIIKSKKWLGRTVVLLCLTVTAISCSDNPALRARYQAEKLLFEADRYARQLNIRPKSLDPAAAEEVMARYDSTLTFCYDALERFSAGEYPSETHDLSLIAYRSAGQIAGLMYNRQQYDSSAAVMERLVTTVPLDLHARITAYLNLGSALQAGGNWDSALSVYNYSLENFYPPVDRNGDIAIKLLNLPTHIYDVYIKSGDTASALVHAERAEEYYRRLIEDHPRGAVSGAGHLNLAGLYERLGRYEEAIDELAHLTDTSGTTATNARMRIASLQAGQLNRPELAIEQYDRILEGLEGRDTLRRPFVLFNKGLVYLYREDYRQARDLLIEIKNRYPAFYNRIPTLQFAIARSFELEGRWDRADTEYRYLITSFPTAEQSLSTYLYLIDHYARENRDIEAARMEEQAEAQYDDIAADYPGTLAEATALSFKAELLRRRGQHREAAEILVDVFDRFPATEIGFRDMVTAALIYRDELSRPETADSLIQAMKRKLTTVDEPGDF